MRLGNSLGRRGLLFLCKMHVTPAGDPPLHFHPKAWEVMPRMIALGLYGAFLEVWLRHIAPERFCVTALERFAENPALGTAHGASGHSDRNHTSAPSNGGGARVVRPLDMEMAWIERCLGLPPKGSPYKVMSALLLHTSPYPSPMCVENCASPVWC